MNHRRSIVALLAFAGAACGASGGFEGKWESTFGGITLELKADHTVAITSSGFPSEGTWEPKGKNQIVVHGPREDLTLTLTKEGALSAGMGGLFVRPGKKRP